MAKTACFHATAEHEVTDIRRLGFKQPIALIPNGIDIPDSPQGQTTRSKTILYLGRLHEGKGVDVLLQAWSAIQNRYPDWHILIAGSDVKHSQSTGYGDFLKEILRELQINNVDFVGDVQGQRKQDLLSSADIYVLPSLSENFGISIAEALSSATPVITTKGTPWNGLITKEAGWWINTGVDPLVSALIEAIETPHARLVKMGRNGRDWMAREMQWRVIAERMRDTYLWLLSPTQSKKPKWIYET